MQRLISGDPDTSKLNVKPTWGVSFGLPQTGGVGPIAPHPGNPLSYPGYGLVGGQGINLGPVSVNPLLALQVTKDEYGEKVVKPYVNLHVTPNSGLVHKLGQLLAYKKYGLYGGHGGVYAPSHGYYHSHYHTHQYGKPFYHYPPSRPPSYLYPSSHVDAHHHHHQQGHYTPIYHKPHHHHGAYYKDYDDDVDYNDYDYSGDYADDYYGRGVRARNEPTRSGQSSSAKDLTSRGQTGGERRPSGKITFSDRRKREAMFSETTSASEVRTVGSVRSHVERT